MPYSLISELPSSVKDALPSGAEHIFLRAFDAAFAQYHDEERSMKIAWGAVKNAGFHKNAEGNWVKTDAFGPESTDDETDCGCGDDEDCECVEEEETAMARRPKYDSVERFDSTPLLNKPERTSQGFLKLDANLTRIGVFEYRNVDGSLRRELRTPEEVLKPESLATLSAAPATWGHPLESGIPVKVNPNNFKKFSIGVVGEKIRNDGRILSSSITVMDGPRIKDLEKKTRKEVSCGYSCRLDMTSGVWNGQPYDAIQKDIVYNHVAIVPKGRAGSEIALRMDSQDAFTTYEYEEPLKEKLMDNVMLNIDGVDFEMPHQTKQAIEKALKDASKGSETIKADFEKVKAQLDATKEDLAKAIQARADAEDPAKIQAVVMARVDLLTKAQKIVADKDFSALTDRQVKEAIILNDKPDFKVDDKSDDYIASRFDHIVENFKPKGEALANTVKQVGNAVRSDSKELSLEEKKAAQLAHWKNFGKEGNK